jgi:hypothetical protein
MILPHKHDIRKWFGLHQRYPDSRVEKLPMLFKRRAKNRAANKVARASRKRNRRRS